MVCCGGGGVVGTYSVKILFIGSISPGFCIGESAGTRIPQAALFISNSARYEFCVTPFHNTNYWISSYRPTATKLDLCRA